jgi:hypothetical protein
MTHISIFQLIKGIFKNDTANSVFMKDCVMQPGIWRFLRFWVNPFYNSYESKLRNTQIM